MRNMTPDKVSNLVTTTCDSTFEKSPRLIPRPYLLRDLDDADRLIGEPGERDLADPAADDPLDLGDPEGERRRDPRDPCDPPPGEPDGDREPDLGGGDLEGEEEEDEDESASAMADEVASRSFQTFPRFSRRFCRISERNNFVDAIRRSKQRGGQRLV